MAAIPLNSTTTTRRKLTLNWQPLARLLCACLLLVAATSLLFVETVLDIVRIWQVSPTFEHGFLVVPVTLWLVWRQRAALQGLPIEPSVALLVPVLASSGLWLLGRLLDFDVLEHVAFVLILISVVVSVIGLPMAKALAFPLGFLLFAAPVGDNLMPMMMRITADLTVAAVQLTGIPVYREGLFFSLPSADWSVIEACSGIRYLIASFMLGCLYAHLMLQSVVTRATFLMLSIVIPILANAVRAFLIVMIAHHSNMTLAKGFDHMVYGWVVFAVVMSALFGLGALLVRWEQQKAVGVGAASPGVNSDLSRDVSTGRLTLQALLCLLLVSPAIVLAERHTDTPERAAASEIETGNPAKLPRTAREAGWSLDQNGTGWTPAYEGYAASLVVHVRSANDSLVTLQVLDYGHGSREMISWGNALVPRDNPDWLVAGSSSTGDTAVSLGNHETDGSSVEPARVVLRRYPDERTLWWWYESMGVRTQNRYVAKVLVAASRVTGSTRSNRVVFVTTDAEGREAAQVMQSFLRELYPDLVSSLDTER